MHEVRRVRGIGRWLCGVALLLPLVGLLVLPSGGADAAGTVQVRVDDFYYDQPTITITVGTKVKWTNYGNQQHTVTSFDGSFASSPYLVSGTTSASYTYTFTMPGVYDYYCIPHTFMLGTITVVELTATPLPAPSRRPARATPIPVPGATNTVVPTRPRGTPEATRTPTPLPQPMRRP